MNSREEILDSLVKDTGERILLVVLDGLGDLPYPGIDKTALEAANTPNLDKLAYRSELGMHDPISYGITPGSGPAHAALFGYDPFSLDIGRGILAALGINFPVQKGDVCARMNFATIKDGKIVDRRAGRISTKRNKELIKKLRENFANLEGVEVIFDTVKEYRGLLVIRGEGLSAEIADLDPQATDVPPLEPRPKKGFEDDPSTIRTCEILKDIIKQVAEILKEEAPANYTLFRGFEGFHPPPSYQERFKLKAGAIAAYPMYRGLASLAGMELIPTGETFEDEVKTFEEKHKDYDYIFLHYKKIDTYGEDGNFEKKVQEIEHFDSFLPRILACNFDVVIITGDHSTPCTLRRHSDDPVPFILSWKYARKSKAPTFTEENCMRYGNLGRLPAKHLMRIALAKADRINKFGA